MSDNNPKELKYCSRYYFDKNGELEPNKELIRKFFTDNMLNRTLTMFKYRGLPETLPERELELILQINGYGIVTEHDGNVVGLWGGFAPPCDLYYRPTKVRVDNPWAKINKEYEISKDCVLVRNDPLNRGLMPILNKYGEMLTESDITMLLSLINFRAIYGITANDDATMESGKEFLKQIAKGKQGVMMGDELQGEIKTQPFSNSSSGYLTQVIEMNQYIKGAFYQEIGLQSTFNMKRERLSEAESGMDEDCLRPLIDSMLEERQKAVAEINEKYGLNISVEFNSSWSKYNEAEEVQFEYSEDDGSALEVETEDEVVETEEPEVEETETEEPEVETEEATEETTEEEPKEEEPEELPEEVVEKATEEIIDKVVEEIKEEVLEEIAEEATEETEDVTEEETEETEDEDKESEDEDK